MAAPKFYTYDKKLPTYCPKCGSLISLVDYDSKQLIGCSNYPKCDYIVME